VCMVCYEFFGCNDQRSSRILLLLRLSSLSNSDEQKNSANMCVIFTVQAENDNVKNMYRNREQLSSNLSLSVSDYTDTHTHYSV